ncbi:MAG: flagellar M-ring protein FliF [Buchnera aphidicola (Periphyllus aceris)]|nr:flagellar M-ring protein FliF [Buchnera aphidicola (Periphyllus aceris)]
MGFKKKNNKNIFHHILFYFRKNKKLLLIFFLCFLITFISFFIWFYYPNYKFFYKNLFFHDNNFSVKKFENMSNINNDSKILKSSFISKEKQNNTNEENVLGLNSKNLLPGFELLDEEKFGISSFNEQINYQRALEGELSRTIERIICIKNARVHLSIPKISYVLNEQNFSSASVFLNINKGSNFNKRIYNSIINLLSTSIYNLPKKNITIINQFGDLLRGSDKFLKNETHFDSINYINFIEKRYKNKIENVLFPIFGKENVIVQVTAKTNLHKKDKRKDYNQKEITKELTNFNSDSFNKYVDFNKNFCSDAQNNFIKNTGYELHNYNFLSDSFNNIDTNFDSSKNIIKPCNNKESMYQENFKNFKKRIDLNENPIISITIVLNYKKKSNGDYVSLNDNEILNLKKIVRKVINFSIFRGDSIDIFNYKFTNLDPPILKYTPIQKKESINRIINLVPWFLLFFFLSFFITSFYSFKKITKKFQDNNLNFLISLKKCFEDNQDKNVLLNKNLKNKNNLRDKKNEIKKD